MPWGFQEVKAPRFQDNLHMMLVRLSALRTGRLYPPGNIPGTHLCQRLSQPQGHSAAGRITCMSINNSNDSIGNRARDLPASNAVPQPTAPPCAPVTVITGRQKFVSSSASTRETNKVAQWESTMCSARDVNRHYSDHNSVTGIKKTQDLRTGCCQYKRSAGLYVYCQQQARIKRAGSI